MSRRRLLLLPCLWAACTSLQVALCLLAEYAFVQLRPTAPSSARVASSRPLSRSPARFPLCRDQVQRPHRLRRGRGREPPSGRPPSRSRLRATPLVGTEAPPFTAKAVSDKQFLDVSLSQYWGEKYVVLFFYPLDFSTICPTEILAFSDRYSEFTDLGAEVLGVSVDSEYAHLAWIEMPRDKGGLGNVSYPLVSDLRKEIASAYEVLGPDGTALRALFIIDKEGIVQHSAINNVDMGRSVDEVLRVLQAIQFVQSNPDQVCPEGWQPEGRTSEAEEAAQEAEEAKDEESAVDAGDEDRLTVLPLDLIPDLADHRAD